MIAVLIATAVACAGFSWMALSKARLHQDLSDAYSLVARMLNASDLTDAGALAEQHRHQKMAEGRWKS